MQVTKQQGELVMEQQTGSKLGKEYVKAMYCHPAYLAFIQSKSYEMLSWMKHNLESRLPGEISINSDTQMTPLFWQKAEELKSVLMKVKESGKSCLKTRHSKNEEYGIQFHHFMANIWGNNGYSEKLCFLGLQNQYG